MTRTLAAGLTLAIAALLVAGCSTPQHSSKCTPSTTYTSGPIPGTNQTFKGTITTACQ